jgi:hypothetical protein
MLLVAAFTAAVCAAGEGYDLYLLVGQSNMAGRGKVDEESKRAHPRVFMLTKDGAWAPATDPLHFDKPSAVGVGPGLAFGKAMADANPQAKIGLIPCAVGGTAISRWTPGAADPVTKTHPYDDAIRRAKLAQKDGVLKGIIWHQGEGDRGAEPVKLYAGRLTELIERLRKELNAPDAPFVAGELAAFKEPDRESIARFNAVVQGLAKTAKRYACVSATGMAHRGDQLHFDTASARELGKRYAAAMLELQKQGGNAK